MRTGSGHLVTSTRVCSVPISGRIAPWKTNASGLNALVYGHQYLAMAGVTCAIAADLDDLKRQFEKVYASVADLQHHEIDRLGVVPGTPDAG